MTTRDRFAAAVALSLIVALCAARPASATPVATVTYTGQATEIFDPTGLFGDARTDLFSASFVNTFTVDLSKGYLYQNNVGGSLEDQLVGGSLFGAPTPIMSATLVINGHAVDFAGDRIGQEVNREGVFVNSAADSGAIGGESGYSTTIFTTIETNAPLSLSNNYFGTAAPKFGYGGDFGICYMTAISANVSVCPQAGQILQGFLTAQTVTISVSDSVPEPGSWALMLAGAACVGATLRLRRKPSVAS